MASRTIDDGSGIGAGAAEKLGPKNPSWAIEKEVGSVNPPGLLNVAFTNASLGSTVWTNRPSQGPPEPQARRSVLAAKFCPPTTYPFPTGKLIGAIDSNLNMPSS